MNRFYFLLRLPLFYRVFLWMIAELPFLLPLNILKETDSLLAFRHPKPLHPFHVVLISKAPVRSFTEIEPGHAFMHDLVRIVQELVSENRLSAYRLIVNGGGYQEFPYLHFHLVSGPENA